jgi:putative endonuclease
MEKGGCIYILASKTHSTLYVGVTSDLYTRLIEHRSKHHPTSFTAKYNVSKLVYFEKFHSIVEAISREKQIKGGSRQKKIDLVNSTNPKWEDLLEQIKNW